jgi:2-phosphoglycerate kinase
MSHDKIKSATRERMTVTGEPYAAARREVMREHQAASDTRRSELADATVHNPPPAESMLLWINGPCGVGKTATAFELNRRLPGSVVCDPADIISESAGLTITPSTDGPVRAWLHRYATTARHIRWG